MDDGTYVPASYRRTGRAALFPAGDAHRRRTFVLIALFRLVGACSDTIRKRITTWRANALSAPNPNE
jgi:hypothetical protein